MAEKTTKELYVRFVTDIETSQRLYACGFIHPTMFYWVANPQLDTLELYQYRADPEYQGPRRYIYPAPIAPEIRERLPNELWLTIKGVSFRRRHGLFHFAKFKNRYIVSLMVEGEDRGQLYEFHREEDTNEASASGKMLCFILESKLDELPR